MTVNGELTFNICFAEPWYLLSIFNGHPIIMTHFISIIRHNVCVTMYVSTMSNYLSIIICKIIDH